MKNRARKRAFNKYRKSVLLCNTLMGTSELEWLVTMAPVGREFGSLEWQLAEMVDKFVTASGMPQGFDSLEWVIEWGRKPQPALGGRIPVVVMTTPEGFAQVQAILSAMKCGDFS